MKTVLLLLVILAAATAPGEGGGWGGQLWLWARPWEPGAVDPEAQRTLKSWGARLRTKGVESDLQCFRIRRS